MVKLDQAADKEKIIIGGPWLIFFYHCLRPWLIFYHCLAVSQWSLEFASPNAKIEHRVVWVHFLVGN